MDSQLVDIISTSIEASIDPTLWNKALDLFVDHYGFKSGVMGVIDPKHESRMSLAASQFLREDAAQLMQAFMQRKDADDSIAFNKVFQLPKNNIASEFEMFEANQYEDLPFSSFRDYMKQTFNITHRYGSKLNQNGPWLDCLILHSIDHNKLLYREEINHVSSILSSSLKSFRVMQQLHHQFNATLNALDNLGIACFLTNDNSIVIHNNLAASELIDMDDGLSLNKLGQLTLSDHNLNAEIQYNCHQIVLTAQGKNLASESVISVKRPSSKTPYLLIINPIIDIHAELENNLKSALVYIIDPTLPNTISIDGLVMLGKLTQAEESICGMLIKGFTTDQIIEQRNVSENTIRQQIKTILNKLHCHSRIDLLRLAIDSWLPLRQ